MSTLQWWNWLSKVTISWGTDRNRNVEFSSYRFHLSQSQKSSSPLERIVVHAALQTEKDILLQDELEQIKDKYPNRFKLWYTVDRPDEGSYRFSVHVANLVQFCFKFSWKKKKNSAGKRMLTCTLLSGFAAGWRYSTGFVNSDMIKEHLPAPTSDTLIVMCGPPPMIKFACNPNLEKLGYKKEHIFEY